MERNTPTKALIVLSAIMTILAGIIHLVLVSAHMEHVPAHGLFFLLVGIAQISWGVMSGASPPSSCTILVLLRQDGSLFCMELHACSLPRSPTALKQSKQLI